MKIKDIELLWLGHSSFMIKTSEILRKSRISDSAQEHKVLDNKKTIYIDPFQISRSEPKADVILITHSHYDHCSIADIEKIIRQGTVVVVPPDCQSKITKLENVEMQIMIPGDEFSVEGIKIQAVPAYNINKQHHPKSEEWQGYLVKFDKVIFYHAGDTDLVPEMQKLSGYGKKDNEFVALFPVDGKFAMTAEEAAQAASIIKPTLAIPMHYGNVQGTKEDAERFVAMCLEKGIHAKILEKS